MPHAARHHGSAKQQQRTQLRLPRRRRVKRLPFAQAQCRWHPPFRGCSSTARGAPSTPPATSPMSQPCCGLSPRWRRWMAPPASATAVTPGPAPCRPPLLSSLLLGGLAAAPAAHATARRMRLQAQLCRRRSRQGQRRRLECSRQPWLSRGRCASTAGSWPRPRPSRPTSPVGERAQPLAALRSRRRRNVLRRRRVTQLDPLPRRRRRDEAQGLLHLRPSASRCHSQARRGDRGMAAPRQPASACRLDHGQQVLAFQLQLPLLPPPLGKPSRRPARPRQRTITTQRSQPCRRPGVAMPRRQGCCSHGLQQREEDQSQHLGDAQPPQAQVQRLPRATARHVP